MGTQVTGGTATSTSAFKKTSNWVFYGVTMSCIAIFLVVLIDLLLGYRWNQIRVERLPDIFLGCFAISSNLRSLLESDGGKLSEKQKDIFDKVSILIMLSTIAMYSAVFKLIEMISPEISDYFFLVCIIIILIDTALGIYITKK